LHAAMLSTFGLKDVAATLCREITVSDQI